MTAYPSLRSLLNKGANSTSASSSNAPTHENSADSVDQSNPSSSNVIATLKSIPSFAHLTESDWNATEGKPYLLSFTTKDADGKLDDIIFVKLQPEPEPSGFAFRGIVAKEKEYVTKLERDLEDTLFKQVTEALERDGTLQSRDEMTERALRTVATNARKEENSGSIRNQFADYFHLSQDEIQRLLDLGVQDPEDVNIKGNLARGPKDDGGDAEASKQSTISSWLGWLGSQWSARSR